ncbi:MAG: TetR/AcrR family transcriptional regulator [Mycobacterium sp.]|nr:TetR/AcrR family transcriptional regulator [Mycobacterium sp.]
MFEPVRQPDQSEELATVALRQSPTQPAPPRRPRGEARRLLLAEAQNLFSRKDYRSTTTREIADAAGVTEHLLFRYFGSKAGLFREALVLPFTDFVDGFAQTWQALRPDETDEQTLARQFVGQLYDVLAEHRGLLFTLVAAEDLGDDEMESAGIADIRQALATLGRISAEGGQLRGMKSDQPDLPAHSTVAMIVGMVALHSTFFGADPPSRDAIVDELVQATLHGFLHRTG